MMLQPQLGKSRAWAPAPARPVRTVSGWWTEARRASLHPGGLQNPRVTPPGSPEALANGGRLLGQKLVPLCRECNARKGKTQTDSVILRPAT